MKFVELGPTTWNENCRNCQVANKRVIPEAGDVIFGRPEKLLEYMRFNFYYNKPTGFDEWAENPVVTGELWYCPICETLWDVNGRFHFAVECTWNGEITQSNDVINMPSSWVDLSPRPSPLHTLCTQCNIWREIVSTDIVYQGTLRKVARTHRCSRCCTADTTVQDEPEVEEMIKSFTEVPRDFDSSGIL